jgi:hypothetical protein
LIGGYYGCAKSADFSKKSGRMRKAVVHTFTRQFSHTDGAMPVRWAAYLADFQGTEANFSVTRSTAVRLASKYALPASAWKIRQASRHKL